MPIIVRFTSAVLAASVLAGGAPICKEHDHPCHTLAEPPHTHNLVPSESGRILVVNSTAASGSNVSVGFNRGVDAYSWQLGSRIR